MVEAFGNIVGQHYDEWADDSDAQDALLHLTDRLIFLVEGRPDFAQWEQELSP